MKYPSVEASTKAVEERRIKFYPERWTETYPHWMHNLRDWCISRQLWWGHRVPGWYNPKGVGKLSTEIPIIELSGNELSGADIKELRGSAWKFVHKNSFL